MNLIRKWDKLAHAEWKRQAAALLVVGSLFLFLGLGNGKLWDRDETTYAEVVREMIQTGDWVVPRYNGELLADKPVLSYWAMIVGARLFGMNEFGMRFFSAASGLACVLVVFALARRMYGPETGFLAGLILLSSFFFLVVCRSALMDAHLTLFVTCALWGFWEALRNPDGSLLWMLLCGGATGLAVLAKGPLGLLLVGTVGLFTLVGARKFSLVRKLHPVAALTVFLLVASSWYVAITWKIGWDFLRDFIIMENLDKVFRPTLGHGGPVWYYLPVLLFAILPWSLFLPWAVRSLWKQGWEEKAFLLGWAVIPFVFFSLLGTKLPHYILPIFPALALITARALVGAEEDKGTPPGYILHGLCGLGIVLLIGGVAGWIMQPAVAGWRLPLTLLPLCLGWAIAVHRPNQYPFTWPYLVGSMLLFILVAAHVMVPHLDRFRVVHQAAAHAARWAEEKTQHGQRPRLLAYRYREPGMLFYARQGIAKVGDDRLQEALVLPGPLLVIARSRFYEQMSEDLKSQFRVRARYEGYCENKGQMTLLLLEAIDRHEGRPDSEYVSLMHGNSCWERKCS
jgi:4-amino-4-deoxy-L-arabinose transferase-like glycosyltransferase